MEKVEASLHQVVTRDEGPSRQSGEAHRLASKVVELQEIAVQQDTTIRALTDKLQDSRREERDQQLALQEADKVYEIERER